MLAQKRLSKKKVFYLVAILAASLGATGYLLYSNAHPSAGPSSGDISGLISLVPTVNHEEGGNVKFIDPSNLLDNSKFKELVDNSVAITVNPDLVGKRDPFAPFATSTAQAGTFSLQIINTNPSADNSQGSNP